MGFKLFVSGYFICCVFAPCVSIPMRAACANVRPFQSPYQPYCAVALSTTKPSVRQRNLVEGFGKGFGSAPPSAERRPRNDDSEVSGGVNAISTQYPRGIGSTFTRLSLLVCYERCDIDPTD